MFNICYEGLLNNMGANHCMAEELRSTDLLIEAARPCRLGLLEKHARKLHAILHTELAIHRVDVLFHRRL